jgi:photosystem II stability/assembly factor-like uncharacterized protein
MALLYPDILEHNNPNNPLMDDGQLWGGLRIVDDKTARNAIPLAKRKIGMAVAWYINAIPILGKYIGADTTDPEWTNDANWVSLSYPYFNYGIDQILTANTTTSFAIGNKNEYATFILYYQMVRDSKIAVGQIEIMQNVSALETPVFFTYREFGGSLGMIDITTSFNVDDVEVTIEIDGSSVSDVTMSYNIIRKPFAVLTTEWIELTSPVTNGFLRGVHFIDANTGWVSGQDGSGNMLIMKTIDGGANWTQQTSPVGDGALNSIFFIDANNGWAAGFTTIDVTVILNTIDGGANWTQQTTPVTPGLLNTILFVDANNGWAVGNASPFGDGRILHTTDGGINWNEQTEPVTLTFITSAFFTDLNNGWATADDNAGQITILNTIDGGVNWTLQTPPIASGGLLHSVFFRDSNNGWIVGTHDGTLGIIFKTIDGGANWTDETPIGILGVFRAVFFTDANNGWIVGYSSGSIVIYHTSDGGANWALQTSPVVSGFLFNTFFINSIKGYAVGQSGSDIVILKYTP